LTARPGAGIAFFFPIFYNDLGFDPGG